jgi:hypothetical protein
MQSLPLRTSAYLCAMSFTGLDESRQDRCVNVLIIGRRLLGLAQKSDAG